MNAIRSVAQLNQRELDAVTPPSASWHADYRHTAFVFVGGLDQRLSEGDVIVIFSQFGEPVYLNLVRDRDTGKSKGFGFLKYADQRSCDLAVDNLSGAEVLGWKLRVDHCEYKVKEGERVWDNTYGSEGEEDTKNGASATEDEEDRRPVLDEERELEKLIREHDDEDPMKDMLVRDKREEVQKAVERWKREDERKKDREQRHKKRKHRSRRERLEDDALEDGGRRKYRRCEGSRDRNDEKGERRERYRISSAVADGDRDGRRRRSHTRSHPLNADREYGANGRHRDSPALRTKDRSRDRRDDRTEREGIRSRQSSEEGDHDKRREPRRRDSPDGYH